VRTGWWRAHPARDDVTGPASRADVHALRAVHDAIVVGIETVLVDRPRLDCRLLAGGVDRDRHQCARYARTHPAR
jgi:diaminohydroxyphosphoribosylaminopyrimidine deaminase/5-amino-6-(5-phosphoribosylamino)uracil reductase